MEYDNDRKIIPTNKTEIFYWVVFALLCPAINAITFFWFDAIFWPVLLITSIISFPIYFFYSRIVVAELFFKERYIAFAFASLGIFMLIQFIVMGMNALILQFPLSLSEQFFYPCLQEP